MIEKLHLITRVLWFFFFFSQTLNPSPIYRWAHIFERQQEMTVTSIIKDHLV